MKELTVRRNDAGQRLDRFVGKAVPLLPETLLQKYIRIKRIKLNGKGAKRDTRLSEGDVLGCVLFAGTDSEIQSSETDYKLAQTIAGFLGRHMES